MNQEPPEKGQERRRWEPRFGIRGMLLAVAIFSLMAAAGSYLAPALKNPRALGPGFIVFTMVAPVALLIVVAIGRALWDLRKNK